MVFSTKEISLLYIFSHGKADKTLGSFHFTKWGYNLNSFTPVITHWIKHVEILILCSGEGIVTLILFRLDVVSFWI